MKVCMLYSWPKFGCNFTLTFQFYIFSLSCNLTSNDLWYHSYISRFLDVSVALVWLQLNFNIWNKSNCTYIHCQHILQLDRSWPLTLVCASDLQEPVVAKPTNPQVLKHSSIFRGKWLFPTISCNVERWKCVQRVSKVWQHWMIGVGERKALKSQLSSNTQYWTFWYA